LLKVLQDAPSGLAKLELGRMKYSLLLLRAQIFLWDEVNQEIPSSDHPCVAAEARNSSADSESVTYMPRSPKLHPSSRNCNASVVFPVPGMPSTR